MTIDYVYDPLYRLTEANYSNGDYYHYAYDAVGNRLSQTTQLAVNSYQYDNANRLTSVNGVPYMWDANGNLLSDGLNSYTYDSANRLISFNGTSSYAYNGMGDRLSQSGVNYTLDLNAGLTQVLSDGTNTYLYGMGRIAENQGSVNEYYLADALGSVRQLTNAQGQVTLTNAYQPYGTLAQTAGNAQTSYGFTGELTDSSGLVYLRARYYSPNVGRFASKDTWEGNSENPISFHKWVYANSNPLRFTDPTGLYAQVECSKINLTALRRYCEIANGSESNQETIDARWMFFNILANTSMQYGVFSEGYFYAGKMLKNFVQGFSGVYNVPLRRNSTYGNDYGILRATKIELPAYRDKNGNMIDEPDNIRPLLYVFLQDHIQPALQSCTTYLLADEFTVTSRETWSGQHSPRPYDIGWWGAFGHVEINATYSNTFAINFPNFYYIRTHVKYNVSDRYAWFRGKSTPFGSPLASGRIEIPHEWEISLVNHDNSYGRKANMYNFTIEWSEPLEISLKDDFSEFSIWGSSFRNIFLK